MEEFPRLWKRARLKIIHKAGNRDWTNPSSFRLISLLPVIGKIFERIISARLLNDILTQGCLSEAQFSFVPDRSTADVICKILSTVRETDCKYVVVLLVDFKGAFDSVWWPGILERLKELNVSRPMFRVIQSYLSGRSLTIDSDGVIVQQVMDRGCPQGFVLGPLFWNVTFDKLLCSDFPASVSPVAFADDIAFIIEGNSRRQLELDGAEVCSTLENWSLHAKMKIAVEKTKGIILKGKLAGRPPSIRLNGWAICFVDEASYLEVVLDKGMTFLPHAKAVNLKAKSLFGKLTRLIRLKYGVRFAQLNFLYKTVFLPIMSYGIRGWSHRIDHTLIAQKLRDAQRQVLISMTRGFRTSPLSALCVITDNLPLNLKLKMVLEVGRLKRGLMQGTRRDIMDRFTNEWQVDWEHAETGRKTFVLLPDVHERGEMEHIQLLDYTTTKLLTGHGAFGTYLFEHGKKEDPNCESCGMLDHQFHAILECPTWNELRAARSWRLATVIQDPLLFEALIVMWREIFIGRDL